MAVECHVAQAHGADRQHPVPPVGDIKQQTHAQGGGAVHLNIKVIHGGRHSLNEHDDGGADLIRPAVLEPAHQQAHGNADDQAQQHGEHAHLDGDGQLFGQDAGDRGVYLINMAHAQVAVEGIPPEAADLHRQRVQQAHGLKARLDLGLGHFFVVCKVAFHRHQPQQAEHERYNDEQRQDGTPDAFCQIFQHICAHPSFVCGSSADSGPEQRIGIEYIKIALLESDLPGF